MRHVLLLTSLCLFMSCNSDKVGIDPENLKRLEAVTLLGDTLYSYASQDSVTLANYHVAKDEYDSDDLESVIWLGRRTAYMGRFREAVDIYTSGIEKFENEPRLYRHRGHRYISLRKYNEAITDLEKPLI